MGQLVLALLARAKMSLRRPRPLYQLIRWFRQNSYNFIDSSGWQKNLDLHLLELAGAEP